jgi:hypothetical protein
MLAMAVEVEVLRRRTSSPDATAFDTDAGGEYVRRHT